MWKQNDRIGSRLSWARMYSITQQVATWQKLACGLPKWNSQRVCSVIL